VKPIELFPGMKTKQKKSKRGPKKGAGGRPPGPARERVTAMVLVGTVAWLEARYPAAKTSGAAAALALDALSGAVPVVRDRTG